MRKPNISLRSNIYILTGELENDQQFHAQVRGRKALQKLLQEHEKQLGSLGPSHTTINLNKIQLAELNYADITAGCKNSSSWGLVGSPSTGFHLECRCDDTGCPHFNNCSMIKIYNDDPIDDLDQAAVQLKLVESGQSVELKEEAYSEMADILDAKEVLEKDVNTMLKDEFQSGKISSMDNEKMLMTCLVSIERITSDIIHLRDITERLEKDVSEIRNKIYAKLSMYRKTD